MLSKVQVIVPVYKPTYLFFELLAALKKQTVQDFGLLIINSGEKITYDNAVKDLSCNILKIPAEQFDHGGTRQVGVDMFPDSDYYIFFTQDAVPADSCTLKNILDVFQDSAVGCAYGRQLPHPFTGVFGTYARIFNYPEQSCLKTMDDCASLGIKTPFISNSFAAYRKTALVEIGGFPTSVILGEDTYVAAKMLMRGWKNAYCAEAKVYHSHDYTILEEMRRYFDIGTFHASQSWICDTFGVPEGEGMRYLRSEARYVCSYNPLLLIPLCVRNIMKYIGYRIGYFNYVIPKSMKPFFSMNRTYWR